MLLSDARRVDQISMVSFFVDVLLAGRSLVELSLRWRNEKKSNGNFNPSVEMKLRIIISMMFMRIWQKIIVTQPAHHLLEISSHFQ